MPWVYNVIIGRIDRYGEDFGHMLERLGRIFNFNPERYLHEYMDDHPEFNFNSFIDIMEDVARKVGDIIADMYNLTPVQRDRLKMHLSFNVDDNFIKFNNILDTVDNLNDVNDFIIQWKKDWEEGKL